MVKTYITKIFKKHPLKFKYQTSPYLFLLSLMLLMVSSKTMPRTAIMIIRAPT